VSGNDDYVWNSGGAPLYTTLCGTAAISGNVTVTGTVAVSGTELVYNSGGAPLYTTVCGIVAVSGNDDYVWNSGGAPLYTTLCGTAAVSGYVTMGIGTVDSGPVTFPITRVSSVSGPVDGDYDVLAYTSYTLGVKFSGVSGNNLTVILQQSVTGSGTDWIDEGASGTFSGGVTSSWDLLVASVLTRYARVYYHTSSTGASGDILVYFQAQT
jgi:hypothetical protein